MLKSLVGQSVGEKYIFLNFKVIEFLKLKTFFSLKFQKIWVGFLFFKWYFEKIRVGQAMGNESIYGDGLTHQLRQKKRVFFFKTRLIVIFIHQEQRFYRN